MNLRPEMTVHLIGIGGTGLSAIARVLLERGYRVRGSDRQETQVIRDLRSAGAVIAIGHSTANIHPAELVIRSSAIPDDNPEVQEALRTGIPVLKRADFLGELMADKVCIAVAGTHGKTTTTAMLAWVFSALGKDPSFIIGGVSRNLGINARAGRGPHFIIEADEYDRMFLGLQPSAAIITNIEHDHPDCFPTADDFYQAFLSFTQQIKPGGGLFLCVDDPGAARLFAEISGGPEAQQQDPNVQPLPGNVHTYGIEARGLEVQAGDISVNNWGGFTFSALSMGKKIARVQLQVPGLHNVRNALGVLSLAQGLGLHPVETAQALGEFTGATRRFEVRGEVQGVTVIDDYGHHPTEIRVILAAARARYPARKIWAVWQPHTYSRTRQFFKAFATAFGEADHVVVTEIYASRESAPQDGYSSRLVVEAMPHQDAHYVPGLHQAAAFLVQRLRHGDILIVFSAGDADQISSQVLAALEQAKLEERKPYHV